MVVNLGVPRDGLYTSFSFQQYDRPLVALHCRKVMAFLIVSSLVDTLTYICCAEWSLACHCMVIEVVRGVE